MTVRQQWAVVGGIVVVLAAAIAIAIRTFGDEMFQVTVGSKAPEFNAITLDSVPRPVTLATWRGEVVLLNIWATWCVPCRAEMPSIEALHQAMTPKGLKIVAVSIDSPGMRDRILAFRKELGLTFEIVYDTTGAIRDAYQANGVPETFIIGRDGVIRRRMIGAADWNDPVNRALITELLGERADGSAR